MDVPLIGQPKTIGGTLTIVMECPCGAVLPLLSQVVQHQLQSVPNRCKCGQYYALGGVTTADGKIAFSFAHVPSPS